jgi:hypothetical protein
MTAVGSLWGLKSLEDMGKKVQKREVLQEYKILIFDETNKNKKFYNRNIFEFVCSYHETSASLKFKNALDWVLLNQNVFIIGKPILWI